MRTPCTPDLNVGDTGPELVNLREVLDDLLQLLCEAGLALRLEV